MRIAYLLADPGIGVFGTKGASVHVQEIVRAFRERGHHVRVYCLLRGLKNGEELVPDDLADLEVVTVPVAQTRDRAERELRVAEAAARLAERAAEDAAGAGLDLVYERYALFSDAGVRLREAMGARGHAPRLALEVNAPLIDEQREHRGLHHDALASELTDRALAGADIVSCVSAPVAAWVTSRLPGAAELVRVIPNGVNTERIRPVEVARSHPFTVGFVGTLKPWHGTEVLLEAFARAARTQVGGVDWVLQVYGDGPQRAALEELATRLGIAAQTRFHGSVPPSEVPGLLADLDVAAAPYPQPSDGGHYFSPLKVYEYLAAGLAVVASEVGELPGLLAGGVGLGVRPGDVGDLAAALERLAADPGLRARLGAAGRRAAVSEHSWQQRSEVLLEALGLPTGTPAGAATV